MGINGTIHSQVALEETGRGQNKFGTFEMTVDNVKQQINKAISTLWATTQNSGDNLPHSRSGLSTRY